MSTQYLSRLKENLSNYARQYYLRLPWCMSLSPVELSALFATLERNAVEKSRVSIGHKVTLFDVQEKEIFTLVLTSPRDSNPEKGFISYLSPLGRQLIGRMPGDVVETKMFCRSTQFRIVRIEQQ